MKEGKLKSFLYKTRIIPIYSKISNKLYDRKIKRRLNPNRWYFSLLPICKRKIVFDSYLGKGYSDNPKAIAEEIIRQGLQYDLVWLTNKNEDMPSQIRQVRYGSLEAMKELATAKMWIFNCRTVFHPNKRKKQIYLQTWHGGFALKKIEKDASDFLTSNYIHLAMKDGSITDGIIVNDKKDESIFRKSFWLTKDCEYLNFGLPRLDRLLNKSIHNTVRERTCSQLGISNDSYIVLYAPTFRDSGSLNGYITDFVKIKKALQSIYQSVVILVRMHPNIHNNIISNESGSVKDVSSFDDIQDLIITSDCLISDYSSTIFDFALMEKPVFLYVKDLQEYSSSSRELYGVYYDLPFKRNFTEDELISDFRGFDMANYHHKLDSFFRNYPHYNNGTATKKTVAWVNNKMNQC